MNADGDNKIQLTQRSSEIDAVSYYGSANPVWSPDGKRILYKSHQNGKTNLYTITPDGKELSRVTNFPSNEYADKFDWSPNGNKIAVSTDLGIYILNENGGGQERIMDKLIWDLSWSPDGDNIMIECGYNMEVHSAEYGIYKVKSDGSKWSFLGEGDNPSWSPVRVD